MGKKIILIHYHNEKWIIRGYNETKAKQGLQFQKRSDATKVAKKRFPLEKYIIMVHDKNGIVYKNEN